jgi:hypothetical protein
MSRKHFNAIAKAINALPDKADRIAMVRTLLPVLRQSNANFNASRFCAACGLDLHADL